MPRKARDFTQSEIAKVRRMHKQGQSNHAIAAALGVRPRQLEWFMRYRKFGHLPSRRGQQPDKRPVRVDDEKGKMCFGCPDSEWQARRDKIKNSWDSDQAALRSRAIMPNRERPKGLEWLRDDPRKDNKRK